MLVLIGLTTSCPSWAVDAKATGQVTLFARTVAQLDSAAPDNSALFATIALSRLADAYYQEAEIVYETGRSASKKQRRWARSVSAYAQEIVYLNDQIINGAPASVLLYPHSETVVKVSGRLITLSHPRMDQQAIYEQSVLQQYCELMACTSTDAGADDWARREQQRAENPQVNWRFTESGSNCSQQGLTITFGQTSEFRTLRNKCTELFAELDSLIQALHWQQRHGVRIDWNRLSISAMHQGDDHVVVLNGVGDSVVASLPQLYVAKELFQELTPWLQAQLDGASVIYEIRIQ